MIHLLLQRRLKKYRHLCPKKKSGGADCKKIIEKKFKSGE